VKCPTSNQSTLRCPLDQILGSRGQIRLLRVLITETEHPLHPSEAAARAGMTESGARRALQRLTRTGLVERARNGNRSQYVFHREGSLSRELARLFESERAWGSSLAQAARRALHDLPHPPELVWVQDFLSGWTDSLEVGVFLGPEAGAASLDTLEARLLPIQEDFGVMLKVRAYDSHELEGVDWPRTAIILGALPEGLTSRTPAPMPEVDGKAPMPATSTRASIPEVDARTSPFSSRSRLNPRSSVFSEALVALLEENLSVLRRARENVRGRLQDSPNGHSHDLWEWQKILDTFSLPRLLNFLESDTPRAERLRETSPFPAVLSEEEKERLAELAGRRQGFSESLDMASGTASH